MIELSLLHSSIFPVTVKCDTVRTLVSAESTFYTFFTTFQGQSLFFPNDISINLLNINISSFIDSLCLNTKSWQLLTYEQIMSLRMAGQLGVRRLIDTGTDS